MTKVGLYFSGRRCRTARAEKAGGFVQIEPTGIVRQFDLDSPMGTWRSFSELDLGSLDATVGFISRFGDPFAVADEPLPANFSTRDWQPLRRVLAQAAAAYTDNSKWDSERRSCLELFPEENERRLAAIAAIDALGPISFTMPLGPNAVDFRVARLADHLRASARIFLGASIPMRRCGFCRVWIGAEHKSVRFCDAVCRNNAHRQRGREEAV